MPIFTTRPARIGDLPNIQQMIRALSAFHGETATVTLSQPQDINFDAAKGRAFVAEDGNRTAGYAGVLETVNVHFAKPRFDIHHMFVAEAMRGEGIGRLLIAAAKDFAQSRGAAGLTIGTDLANLSAQASYRAMGFEKITSLGPRFWIACDPSTAS